MLLYVNYISVKSMKEKNAESSNILFSVKGNLKNTQYFSPFF